MEMKCTWHEFTSMFEREDIAVKYYHLHSPDNHEKHHVEHPIELEEVNEIHPRQSLVLHFQGITVILQVTINVHFAWLD